MNFACTYPELLSKLIVADISPRYYTPHHQDVIAGLQSIGLDTLTSREEADRLLAAHLPEVGVRQFLLKNLYRNDQGKFAWRMNFDTIVEQIENIGEETKGPPFSKPTLFLKGERSRYITEKDEALITQLFPESKTETIADAGHWLQAEQPIAFVTAVINFLNS